LCRQCPEGGRFLCLGCSLIHPKVRAFRGHALVPISPSVGVGVGVVVWLTSVEGLGELCLERVMEAYDTLTRGDLSPLFWRTLCVSLLASVAYHFIVRVVFGKYCTLANVAEDTSAFRTLSVAERQNRRRGGH